MAAEQGRAATPGPAVSTYAWTQEGPRWKLDADDRYQVEQFDDPWLACPYLMLIGGHVVDSASTAEQAREILETRYEYEEHAADLEMARLRLRQARERLASRFPAAARDGQLGSILEGLEECIGRGPEAAEPEQVSPLDAGRLLSPDLALVVDGSANIVLVVMEPYGGQQQVVRTVTVGNVDAFKAALDDARTAQQLALEEAGQRRAQGPDEHRRAQGRLDRREAVDWLVARGPVSRQRAVHMVRALSEGALGVPHALGMTYEDGCWRVPAE